MLARLIEKFRLKREMANQFESVWLRNFYNKRYFINIGMYSYGCFDPVRIPKKTYIGRYCSISSTCWVLNGNHGLNYLSLHPYLYNVSLGLVKNETISRTELIIEDDVWIGHNAIILPSVTHIGRGAVVAAGAVVTKNVKPYEIVASNPARHIRFRFEQDIIDKIEASQWWLKSKAELLDIMHQEPDMIYNPSEFFRAGATSIDNHGVIDEFNQ